MNLQNNFKGTQFLQKIRQHKADHFMLNVITSLKLYLKIETNCYIIWNKLTECNNINIF